MQARASAEGGGDVSADRPTRKTRGPGRPKGGIAEQFDRVFRVRGVLIRAEGHAVTLDVLAKRFGVSTRTIRRDIAVLVTMGEAVAVEGEAATWRWAHWEQTRRAFDLLLDRSRSSSERKAVAHIVDTFRDVCRVDGAGFGVRQAS